MRIKNARQTEYRAENLYLMVPGKLNPVYGNARWESEVT